jgi:hypothetical protein
MLMHFIIKFAVLPFIFIIVPIAIVSGLVMYYMDPDDYKDPSSNKDGETEGRD